MRADTSDVFGLRIGILIHEQNRNNPRQKVLFMIPAPSNELKEFTIDPIVYFGASFIAATSSLAFDAKGASTKET